MSALDPETVGAFVGGIILLLGGGFGLGKWKNGGATASQMKALDEKHDAQSERITVLTGRVEDHGSRLGAVEKGQQEATRQLAAFREEANDKLGAIAADVRALYEHATRDDGSD